MWGGWGVDNRDDIIIRCVALQIRTQGGYISSHPPTHYPHPVKITGKMYGRI